MSSFDLLIGTTYGREPSKTIVQKAFFFISLFHFSGDITVVMVLVAPVLRGKITVLLLNVDGNSLGDAVWIIEIRILRERGRFQRLTWPAG